MVNNKTKAKILSDKTSKCLIECMTTLESNDGDMQKSWDILGGSIVITEEIIEEWYIEYDMSKKADRLYEVIHHQCSREQCLECVMKADGDQGQALRLLLEIN